MKKFNLIKVLGISLLIVVLLSWVIPAGYYSNGTFTSTKTTVPVGVFDLFRLPVITIVTFIQYGILLLSIGAFYGVLNKTGVYSKLVDSLVSKTSKKKMTFLMVTITLFVLLASIVGTLNVLFVLVPFFVAVLLKLGYSKITALASTVGSMLVGQIGSTFGFDIWGYLKVIFELKMTDLILVRAILLVIVLALFIILVRKTAKQEVAKTKKSKANEEVIIPLYKSEKSKKSVLPLVIISTVTLTVLLIGVYNWGYAFDIKFFSNLYEAVMDFNIGGYPIAANIIGSISEIGLFGNYDIVVVLLFSSIIMGWIYNVKFSEIIEGIKEGISEMLKPALYAMLASVVFTAFLNMLNTVGYSFSATIVNKFISGSEQFTLFGTIGSGLTMSLAYNDFYTIVASAIDIFVLYDVNTLPIIAFVFQTMYIFVMIRSEATSKLLKLSKLMQIR